MTDLPRRDLLKVGVAAAASVAVAGAMTSAARAAEVKPMRRYVIERTAPGVGAATLEEVAGMAAVSNAAIAQLVPNIQWEQSYRTADKFFCVYLAVDEDVIRKHAEIAGIPVDRITLVTSVVDPTSAA